MAPESTNDYDVSAIAFDAEGATFARMAVPSHLDADAGTGRGDGPRLQLPKGILPRQIRSCGSPPPDTASLPTTIGISVRATGTRDKNWIPGSKSATTGTPSPTRNCWTGWTRSRWRLGLQLRGWPRSRRGSHRPTSEMRGGASADHQRLGVDSSSHAASGPPRAASSIRCRSTGAISGATSEDGADGRRSIRERPRLARQLRCVAVLHPGQLSPPEDQWRFAKWSNEITLRSLELYSEYEPGSYVERIAPTPLLMVGGDSDVVCPTDLTLAAFNRAGEPKRLELYPGGHFSAYTDQFERASNAACQWFAEHLRPSHLP